MKKIKSLVFIAMIVIIGGAYSVTNMGGDKMEEKDNTPTISDANTTNVRQNDYTDIPYVLSKLEEIDTTVEVDGYYRYENILCSVFPKKDNTDKVNEIIVISRDANNPNYNTLDVVLGLLNINDNSVRTRITDVLEHKNGDVSQYEDLMVGNIMITSQNTVSEYKAIIFTIQYE